MSDEGGGRDPMVDRCRLVDYLALIISWLIGMAAATGVVVAIVVVGGVEAVKTLAENMGGVALGFTVGYIVGLFTLPTTVEWLERRLCLS